MLRKMTDSMSNYNENFAEIRYLFRQLIKQMRILESETTSDRIQPFYYSSEEDEDEQPDDLNLSKNRKRKILENVFGSKRAKHHDSGLEMSFDMAQEPVDEFPVIYTPAKEIEMVVIGKHGTKAPKYVVDGVPSMAFSAATKKIMQEVFPKQILATHTLPGNSVSGLEELDEKKVEDIQDFIMDFYNLTEKRMVREIMLKKCSEVRRLF